MIRFLLWSALGYASCVWDSSCSPEHSRWPSATAVFILLLSTREPRYGLWGAAACGLVMDAAQGGLLGPRVVTGVLIATLVGYAQIGHTEAKWLRGAVLVFLFSAGWLLAPRMADLKTGTPGWGSAGFDQSVILQSVSTTLVTLAIRSLLRPVRHADEAHW